MRLAPIRTRVTRELFAASLARAWWRQLKTQPTITPIKVMTAQSGFETGWWDSCWCFNLGNMKHTPSREGDWYFKTCGELIAPARAAAILASAQPRPDGQGPNVELGDLVNVGTAEKPDIRRHVTLYPDHPGSAFRAFRTLDEGMDDHLSMMVGRFGAALPFLLAGDVHGFVVELGKQIYFTDATKHYEDQLRGCIRLLDGLEVDLSPPAGDIAGALPAVQAASLAQASWDAMREDAKDR